MLKHLRFPPIFWFLIVFQGANTVWCFWRYAHNGKGITLASGVFALACWVWIVIMGRQAQGSDDRIAELNVKIAELERLRLARLESWRQQVSQKVDTL